MYKFIDNDFEEALEGRYWNANGYATAIIASVTKGIDWAAYIGATNSSGISEEQTLNFVKSRGCKLSQKDARYFFPSIKLSYRD